MAFTWAQQPQREEMGLTFREINDDWTDAVPPVSHAMPDCALAPRDCGLTENYHVVVENRASIQMAPFVLGLKGPAQVLEIATKEGACAVPPHPGRLGTYEAGRRRYPAVLLHPRGRRVGGRRRARARRHERLGPLSDPTHFPHLDTVPFLGAWSGPAPDFKRIPPSLLFETVVDPATGTLVSHENPPVAAACASSTRTSTDLGRSGRLWRTTAAFPRRRAATCATTSRRAAWEVYAGPRKFCEELVVAPKG